MFIYVGLANFRIHGQICKGEIMTKIKKLNGNVKI